MRGMKLALVVAAFLLPALAMAQVGSVGALSLSIAPSYPRPGSTVTIAPENTLLDLANSTMSISVNGKNIYTGAAKAVQISLGGPGQTTTVGASVTSLGRTYTRTLALKPGDVSLVVEPLATAPALYLGKPLVPLGGSARLVAVADFRTTPASRIDPATLSYAWSVDGTTLIGASGVGRSSVILPSPLAYRSRSVSVVVQSRDGSLVGGDSITLTSQNPVVRLYRNDPLQGIVFDEALRNTYAITSPEISFFAVPYSFTLSSGAPVLAWFLNGGAAEAGPSITLRPEGAGRGRASLLLRSSAGEASAAAELSLTFGESGSTLFGL
ncbi:hypothetical protein A3E65_01465 [Candidatus Kaiserbacteria bacterium RIFCSPHIGHO2_12_FULL_56_13]|uniref:IPT/TIG domain-containing protein n=1 Tax=Candidatus Kaiserbacteria bacterium RIFCSPHIGHO2_12_FULL_56_13 TaxID=1798505 RepID=A0A1F6EGE2_9BACT|nr:MAG: hypothetical protein A3E65_01465 [Candidatus Kaiserbacteria bacterium RIFCSPHIGHO2_12_FULL_56_13]